MVQTEVTLLHPRLIFTFYKANGAGGTYCKSTTCAGIIVEIPNNVIRPIKKCESVYSEPDTEAKTLIVALLRIAKNELHLNKTNIKNVTVVFTTGVREYYKTLAAWQQSLRLFHC